jgi:hypothetical protein
MSFVTGTLGCLALLKGSKRISPKLSKSTKNTKLGSEMKATATLGFVQESTKGSFKLPLKQIVKADEQPNTKNGVNNLAFSSFYILYVDMFLLTFFVGTQNLASTNLIGFIPQVFAESDLDRKFQKAQMMCSVQSALKDVEIEEGLLLLPPIQIQEDVIDGQATIKKPAETSDIQLESKKLTKQPVLIKIVNTILRSQVSSHFHTHTKLVI